MPAFVVMVWSSSMETQMKASQRWWSSPTDHKPVLSPIGAHNNRTKQDQEESEPKSFGDRVCPLGMMGSASHTPDFRKLAQAAKN